jgi:hypothetical protein
MGAAGCARTKLQELLECEIRRAVGLDVPDRLAREAASSTAHALSEAGDCGSALELRVPRYYRRVLARVLTRSATASRARARVLARAVVNELRSSGRGDLDVYRNLARGWGESIPADILEEYRVLLCA